ncbi:MAG TPA: SDR family oxidoreductase [Verrucomicrobiota bacterium]|nr:SDR family oxidoreductase [Verrucomicrobiota bacterium]
MMESNTQSTIWITGAGGLIGNELVPLTRARFPGARVIGLTRAMLDLADARTVRDRFAAERPNLILHCAAISRSPVCQAQPDLARQINVGVTRLLAELSDAATLVLFSTDLVFDGRRGGYTERDEPNPLMVYAETKVDAERIVLTNPRHLVVRTSLNYGHSLTGDRSFNEEILQAWRAGRTLRLFTDEFRAPLAAVETARAVLDLVAASATGLFHVAGRERLSRFQIGELLAARHPEVHPKLEPASTKEFAGAPRPPDVTLNCAKAEAILRRPLPAFSEWLQANAAVA